MAEACEDMEDLVAEVKAELAAERSEFTAAVDESVPESSNEPQSQN